MVEKICWKYNKLLPIEEFIKNRRVNKKRRECYQQNKDKINKKCREHYQQNKDKVSKQRRRYFKQNRDKVSKQRREYNRKYRKKYYQQNRDKVNKKRREHYQQNKDKINKKRREYSRGYYKKCYHYTRFRLSHNMSSLIYNSLKSRKGGKHWEDLVGYNIDKLMQRLEVNFKLGMSWSNYGKYGWHIDHKKPQSLFNFSSYEDKEFKNCWMLCNLQPLWAKENFNKSNKFKG